MDKFTESKDNSLKKSPFDDLDREELVSKCKGLLALAQKAKHAKFEIQNENDKLKALLSACEEENKSKIETNNTLQDFVDSLTEQKLTYITELDSAQSKLKVISKKCGNYEEELKKHKDSLFSKEQDLIAVSQKCTDIDNEVVSLRRQNKRLCEENDQLITQLTELEARTEEFNAIGLKQMEQLKVLEEKAQTDEQYQKNISELHDRIKQLELDLQTQAIAHTTEESAHANNLKLEELNMLYETEKYKNEKANNKLKCYKDKILKCANCINQLKNSRFILTKTVKEYSENIPKWQSEIIRASKVLDDKINDLNNDNLSLNAKILQLETELKNADNLKSNMNSLDLHISELQQKLLQSNNSNILLRQEMEDMKCKYQELVEIQLNDQNADKDVLKQKICDLSDQLNTTIGKKKEIEYIIEDMKRENIELKGLVALKKEQNHSDETLNLQIKALETEKAILVKEKLNARDNLIELDLQNKALNQNLNKTITEFDCLKLQYQNLKQENSELMEKSKIEKEESCNKSEMLSTQELYENLKKEYYKLQDLNGLLQEEVETLRLSLEQPKDDGDNLSDINVSLQADIAKLETKLSAYKQENATLLTEVKESRSKIKDYDNLVVETKEIKSKLLNFKSENVELLNEMKEINQVLKERGESISKLQKAISEMEKLIETLEKDRDSVKEERNRLLQNIEVLQDEIKNAVQNNSKINDVSEKYILERDNAVKKLQEKNDTIAMLREEIEKCRQQPPSDLPNDDMSTSTISKAEEHSRMRDLDETFEDKYTKLRMFALKLKKKLNETTSQLQISEQEKSKLKKLVVDQSSDDKTRIVINQDSVDSAKGIINPKEEEFGNPNTEEVISRKELASLEKEKEKLLVDLQLKIEQLSGEMDAHKNTKEQLEKALRDVKKKNVLSLEIEDYERSMKELTTKMEDSKKKMIQLESTIDTQEGTITAMKTQIKLLEEQIKTEETQNRLVKEELHNIYEESKEKDNVINIKNNIITNLTQDLEDEKRKKEEADIEMTTILSEKENVIIILSEEKIELNNKLKRLEFKFAELNDKLQITNIELADLKTEYTSYKVRAQAVLRQNQTVDHSQEEHLKEETAALSTQIEALKLKIANLQEQFEEKCAEAEASRKRAADAGAEAARAGARTARLHADLARLTHQLDAERAQQKLHVSTLTQCYKSQITELETKLQKETESLKKQLALFEDTAKSIKPEEFSREKYMLPIIPKEETSDGEMDINVSLIPREEGEGSESAPSPPLSKAFMASSRRSPVPLERLLEEGVAEDSALERSSLGLTPEQEISDLQRKVQAQQQKVKHVTVLLAESERECARMAQLSELLKAELRRVRGADQAHNTEYMKNVTLKFLTLPPGDERSRLIPVLQKILTLSQEENHKLQAIAKGQDPNSNKGWGSYLPWPGGK